MAANVVRVGTPLRDAAEADPEAQAPNLEDLTVAELRDYADEHDIDLSGASRKAEIIEAIESSS